MRKALAGLLLFLGLASPALAQTKFTMPPPAGVMVGGLQVVATCGTASGLVAGNTAFAAMDTTGALCTNASGGGGGGLSVAFGGSIGANGTPTGFTDPATGFFQPNVGNTTNGQYVEIKTTSQIHSDLTSAVPALVATAYNTCSYANGTTQPLCMDLNGNLFANISKWGGTLVLSGTGAQAAGSPRVTVATDQATNAGAALVKGGVGVVNGGSTYQHVAASQTAAVLQTSTGAIGDYLSHCVIYPVTTAAGSVTVFDNTNAAGTNVIEFATGTLSNLAPIAIPVGAVSTAGAWKVTTGANETVVCYGKFS